MADIFCGEADKHFRCVNCGEECGPYGHYISEGEDKFYMQQAEETAREIDRKIIQDLLKLREQEEEPLKFGRYHDNPYPPNSRAD